MRQFQLSPAASADGGRLRRDGRVHAMGAGASTIAQDLPPGPVDRATAQRVAGDKYDEAIFLKAASDGVVPRDEFLALATAEQVHKWDAQKADAAMVPESMRFGEYYY